MLSHIRCVQLFTTPWTAACQVPLSMGFSRQEYWSGQPCPSPGDLPGPGIEPGSPELQADSLPSEPPGEPQGHYPEWEKVSLRKVTYSMIPCIWHWEGLLCSVACGSLFPNQGLNPHPLHWKHGILTTGLPGRSLQHPWNAKNYREQIYGGPCEGQEGRGVVRKGPRREFLWGDGTLLYLAVVVVTRIYTWQNWKERTHTHIHAHTSAWRAARYTHASFPALMMCCGHGGCCHWGSKTKAHGISLYLIKIEGLLWRPKVKTPSFHCRGHRVHPWWGTKIPHAAECGQKKGRQNSHI